MLLQELEYKFSILPDDSKNEIVNFINYIYDSTIITKNNNENKIHKKISAKYLLTKDKSTRDQILSNQSEKGKLIYGNNPDSIFPDLVDDIIE